jgi:hypothetical protein
MAAKDLVITENGVEFAAGADRLRWLERGHKAGWRITEFGRLDTGETVGPCARCAAPHELYGEHGNPLCDDCRNP